MTETEACADSPYKWVSTWGTAIEKCDITPEAMPCIPLGGTTVRQIIRPTTTGSRMKLRLSNEYGGSDVKISSLHVAKQVKADESAIDPATDKIVTVGGSESFIIPKGGRIETDAVIYDVNALENLALTAYFAEAPETDVTGHRCARATTYQIKGNRVTDKSFDESETRTTSWFFLADVSLWVPADSRAVVCFGDSITDGYGTDALYLGRRPDSYTRWVDYFAKRLQSNEPTRHVSVVNAGIGGNSMLGAWPTDAGKDRFERDLLEHDGVGYCIVLFGVNDLEKLSDTEKYYLLKPEYERMVAIAHENGIKIYAAPIIPFGNSSHYSESSETVRNMLNAWMRSEESGFDGVIEFANVLADPADSKCILEKYTHSDGLHPYDGYEAMAEIIDLKMFE
ncbi:MAG: hypothetical protein HFH14_09475 [Lachnospiraceae bacterium]|nr:hypothetical protein [Lachnospiraceae bacterium]